MSAEHINTGDPAHFINTPPADDKPWRLPSTRKAGMVCLILTESALFSIFVVAYVWYMGKSLTRRTPMRS